MISLVDTAARIAIRAHADQKRKTDGDPYIVHPFMVAMVLRQHGFSDETIIVALLHDVLEDTKVTADDLVQSVGEKIVSYIQMLSEQKELPWEERKKHYIEAVVSAPEEVKAVSVADKLYNLTDLLSGLEKAGAEYWRHFSRGAEQQKWFFRAFCDGIKSSWKHPLVDELESLVQKLEAIA